MTTIYMVYPSSEEREIERQSERKNDDTVVTCDDIFLKEVKIIKTKYSK